MKRIGILFLSLLGYSCGNEYEDNLTVYCKNTYEYIEPKDRNCPEGYEKVLVTGTRAKRSNSSEGTVVAL